MELFFGTIGESKTLPPLPWDSTLKKTFQLTSYKPLNI
jgi:hypothetical protein